MKNVNLLSRAEMRKVVGGNPVLIGCTATCYEGQGQSGRALWAITMNCSEESQDLACPLLWPAYHLCGSCTYDDDEW